MFKVIIKTSPGFDLLKENFMKIQEIAKEEINKLGHDTAEKMKETISAGKVRPQVGEPTTLENAIEVEYFGDKEGWGVGNIDKLNDSVNYWKAVNYGSSHMVGKHLPLGVFDPGEPAPNNVAFRKGRWKKGDSYDGKSYSPIVKNPIPPMNYIEKTVNWLQNELNNLIHKIKRN